MGIQVPVVIAVSLRAVDLLQFTSLPSIQIQKPLVAFLMPDGEIAIIHQREEHILPIIAGAWPCQTLPHRHRIEDGIDLLSEPACLRIEGNLAEVVLLVLIMGRIVLLLAGHIIQAATIRREDGRILAPVLGLKE